MDKIEIRNLEIFANHGVFPEENVLGQKFVWDWHQFLLDVQEVFYQTEDTELIRNLNMYVISRFYTKPYEESQDFYAQFYERLKEAKNLLSLGV